MKKILFWLFCSLMSLGSCVFAQSSEGNFYYNGFDDGSPTTVQRDIVKDQVIDPNDGILKRTLRMFELDQYINLSDASALEYIKFILNTALGLTSLVALVIILYGFAQIIFAKDDEAIATARKTVQGSAIAIGILAISWFLVTFLFSIYESVKWI